MIMLQSFHEYPKGWPRKEEGDLEEKDERKAEKELAKAEGTSGRRRRLNGRSLKDSSFSESERAQQSHGI